MGQLLRRFRQIVEAIRWKLMVLASQERRIRALRKRGVRIGENCLVYTNGFSTEPYLVEIGDHCAISQGVEFITHDATGWLFEDHPEMDVFGPITVGSNTYFGTNCTILPGTRIGSDCVIGSGAVVRGDVPDGSVVMGNPGQGRDEDLPAETDPGQPQEPARYPPPVSRREGDGAAAALRPAAEAGERVSVDIVKEIQGYVLSEFAAERDEIAPDENLLGQGILDSMGILKLVTFLEQRFGIETVDDDLVPENFESIDAHAGLRGAEEERLSGPVLHARPARAAQRDREVRAPGAERRPHRNATASRRSPARAG